MHEESEVDLGYLVGQIIVEAIAVSEQIFRKSEELESKPEWADYYQFKEYFVLDFDLSFA